MNNITVDELMEIIFAEPDNGCLRAILESLIKDQERLEFTLDNAYEFDGVREIAGSCDQARKMGREAIDDAMERDRA